MSNRVLSAIGDNTAPELLCTLPLQVLSAQVSGILATAQVNEARSG
jgi:hypothetical protein